jgi:chromosome segregation ATPase
MLTTIITTIAIAAVCYAIYLKQELFNTKAESDVLTNDNRLKAESIERHLKEKMEMQQEYNIHLTNLRKRVADLELEVSKSNREYRAQENTIQVIVKDCDDLREIIKRKDETIARYVTEIEKLTPKETEKYVAFPKGYVVPKGIEVICLEDNHGKIAPMTKWVTLDESSVPDVLFENKQEYCLHAHELAPLNPKDHPDYKAPKKPYHFDESKSKQQVVAAKKLRNEKGPFAK